MRIWTRTPEKIALEEKEKEKQHKKSKMLFHKTCDTRYIRENKDSLIRIQQKKLQLLLCKHLLMIINMILIPISIGIPTMNRNLIDEKTLGHLMFISFAMTVLL